MDLPGLIQQELQSQYINPTKLSKLLSELFPGVQTAVEVYRYQSFQAILEQFGFIN
jgi:hypothetical protein